MASIAAIPFTPELRNAASVQQFDCGQEFWESQVSDWLKADHGGAADDAILGNRVWLYLNDDRELVGVGSLGESQASWPRNSGTRELAACITWLGVDGRHQRKGYGQRILDHLLLKAREHFTTSRLVVLYVHERNLKAMEWYARNSFIRMGNPRPGPDGQSYQKMVLNFDPVT